MHLYDQQPVQLYKNNFHQSIQEFQELIQVSKVQLNQRIASKNGFERFFPGKGYQNPEISRATCTSQRYLMVIFGFAIMHQLAISARTNCKGNRWWQCRGARWDEIENLPKFELCDKSLHLLLQFVFISEIRQFPRNPSYSASAGKQIY